MLDSGSSKNSKSAALDAACGKAMQLQLAGQAVLADQLYRELLQAEPTHAMANHCMGMLQVQLQRHAQALPYLAAALNANPEAADFWLGYLEALLLGGRLEEADETLALAVQHGLKGAAVADFARRLALRQAKSVTNAAPPEPASAPAPAPQRALPQSSTSRKIARAAGKTGRVARIRNARPLQQEAALQVLVEQDRRIEALELARHMAKKFPERGLAWKILGGLLWWQGRHDEALAPMRNSARLMPKDAEAQNNLGMALLRLLRYDEAVSCFHGALAIDPEFAAAHYHLGMAHSMQQHYAEAEASLGTAVTLRPDYITAEAGPVHSDLLFIYSHSPTMDADALFEKHRYFGTLLEDPLRAAWPRHRNTKDPNRCLRIGFVSGDLQNHAVATFIEPVFERLSLLTGVELSAYYNNVVEDGVSLRLRTYCRHWHPIAHLSDVELAQKVMDDGIDILIDLSGHTALNRLRTFARKPAPIQASWLGYPGTTGLQAMDYYFADRYWLPLGHFDKYFTEKLVYLPAAGSFHPHASAPPVNALPAVATGTFTFGSFNRLGKINDATIHSWAQLLRALPEARMLLGGMPPLGEQTQLVQKFAAEGIPRERLTLHPRSSMDAYLALHGQVDLCLDTCPYTGGTTTSHALWMGVPTITIAGPTAAARQSSAILSHAGLDAFIAAGVSDFVEIGVHWAKQPGLLADLRQGVRERFRQSLLLNPDVMVAGLEGALRHMWRRWCAGASTQSFQTNDLEAIN